MCIYKIKLIFLLLISVIFACSKKSESKTDFDLDDEKKTLRHIKEVLWPKSIVQMILHC
jgi:hypothetical protein